MLAKAKQTAVPNGWFFKDIQGYPGGNIGEKIDFPPKWF